MNVTLSLFGLSLLQTLREKQSYEKFSKEIAEAEEEVEKKPQQKKGKKKNEKHTGTTHKDN